MFFTFLFSSFLVSKQFITSISNAQARVRKRNISSSKSRPKKNEFKEQRGGSGLSYHLVAFITGDGADIELIHYSDRIIREAPRYIYIYIYNAYTKIWAINAIRKLSDKEAFINIEKLRFFNMFLSLFFSLFL